MRRIRKIRVSYYFPYRKRRRKGIESQLFSSKFKYCLDLSRLVIHSHPLSHLITTWHILSCLTTSFHLSYFFTSHSPSREYTTSLTPCHDLSRLVTSCEVLSPFGTPCHALSYLITRLIVTSCKVLSLAASFVTICHTLSGHDSTYHAIVKQKGEGQVLI